MARRAAQSAKAIAANVELAAKKLHDAPAPAAATKAATASPPPKVELIPPEVTATYETEAEWISRIRGHGFHDPQEWPLPVDFYGKGPSPTVELIPPKVTASPARHKARGLKTR